MSERRRRGHGLEAVHMRMTCGAVEREKDQGMKIVWADVLPVPISVA